MSEEILQANLQYLEKKDSKLKENVMQWVKQSVSEEKDFLVDVAFVEDRKVLYVEVENKQYQLDSLYDSKNLLNTWFDGNKNNNFIKKYLLFGLGNGMYVRKILAESNEKSQITVFEPSMEIFFTVLQNFDCSDLFQDNRFTLIVQEFSETILQPHLYRTIQYSDLEGLIIGDYPNYKTLFASQQLGFYQAIQLVYNSILSTREVLSRYGNSYYENTFANMKELVHSKSLVSLYQKIPKDIPAIMVASGPSLDKNIEELKRAKGKSFIIAADSAVKALLAHDILPDMYVTVDGEKNFAHFADERISQIPMVCYLISNRRALQSSHAPKFFINDDNLHLQKFFDEHNIILPILSTGGSVANEVFSLAQLLDFKTLVFVGQDLAFTDDKTHSQTTFRGGMQMKPTAIVNVMLEGIDGKMIASSGEFQLYLSWFENKIKENPDLRVIDATEGGAMIHGTKIMTLKEVVDEECTKEVNIERVISQTEYLFSPEEQMELTQYLKNIPEELNYVRDLAKRGIRDYEKMILLARKNQYHDGEMLRLYKRNNQLVEEIDAMLVQGYVEHRIQKSIDKVLKNAYTIEKDEKTEIITACEMGKEYLEALLEEIERDIPDILKKMENL